MLAIEIEFLTGRFVATRHDDRDAIEWPPHPARLFSALVAEWAGAPTPDPAEEALLRAVEQLAPPQLAAGPAQLRATVTHYVPVNDPTIIGAALWNRVRQAEAALARLAEADLTPRTRAAAQRELGNARDVTTLVTGQAAATSSPLPEDRGKQPRTFPSVTVAPVDGGTRSVSYLWQDADLTDGQRTTLDLLLQRVTRLGHSSSLVNCRLRTEPVPAPTHLPCEAASGDIVLRAVSPGQLDALVADYARHEGARPRSLPFVPVGYRIEAPAEPVLSPDCAGEWFAFSLSPRLGAPALARLTETVRSVLAAEDADAAEAAFVLGLPNVGHPEATGDLLGFAILLPAGIDEAARRGVLRSIGRGLAASRSIVLGRTTVEVTRLPNPDLATLRRERWVGTPTGASSVWISATPALIAGAPRGRLTSAAYHRWVADWLAESCVRSGLPRPHIVQTSAPPLLAGARHVRAYPEVVQAGRMRRLVHARIEFERPVHGPLLVGGGRHLGFGLMFPVKDPHD